jgi:quercetin dioxygenase-like cupin family protein
MKQILQTTTSKAASMKQTVAMLAVALTMGIVLSAIGSQVLNAQQAPPTAPKGQTVKTIASLEIGTQIPELKGRYLRARMRTLEPGGNGLLHSHKELPVIIYVVRGTLTVCLPDGKCEDIPEGQAVAEGKDVTHWATNKGTTPLTYLVVEIGKQP